MAPTFPNTRLDPTTVWFRPLHSPEQDRWGFRLHRRDTGAVVGAEYGSGCSGIPAPYTPSRPGNGSPEVTWWAPKGHGAPALIARLHAAGLRQNATEVLVLGDPGLQDRPPSTRLLGSVMERTARGQTTRRLVLGRELIDRDGFATLDAGFEPPQALLDSLQAKVERDPDYYDPHDRPHMWLVGVDMATARTRLAQWGYVADPKFPACLRPERLGFAVGIDGDDTVLLEDLDATPWGDDMRDGALAVLPDIFARNIAEGAWEVQPGLSPDAIVRHLQALGYVHMPEIIPD